MNRLPPIKILEQLTQKWAGSTGRRLYLVTGAGAALEKFEEDLIMARPRGPDNNFPVIDLNQAMLDRFSETELDALIAWEPRRRNAVRDRLQSAFEDVLRQALSECDALALKRPELLFAFNLDLTALRVMACDARRVLFLIPGSVRAETLILYADADERFHRRPPDDLFISDHIWEIAHDG